MHKPSILSQIVVCGQRMFIGSWRRLPAQGCPCFWTLNSAKHSVSSMFSRSNLATNFAETESFWNESSPTGPRMLHQKLFYHHTPVTASLLFHEKTFFAQVFSNFRSRFRKGCRRKNTSLLKSWFWRERRRPLTQVRSFVDVAVAPKTSGNRHAENQSWWRIKVINMIN